MQMTGQNVDIVRRFYEAQGPGFSLVVAGRIDEALALPGWALLADDVVLDEVREFPDAGRYSGRDGLLRWVRQLAELFETFENETRSFEQHGDRVLVDVHQRFRARHGPLVEHDVTHAFTLRDGLITHITGYRTREEALGTSSANVEVIRRLNAAFNAGDTQAFQSLLDPNMEFVDHLPLPDVTASARGVDEITKVLERWREGFAGFQADVVQYVDLDDYVVTSTYWRFVSRDDGLALDWPGAEAYQLRDGRVVWSAVGFRDLSAATQAVEARRAR